MHCHELRQSVSGLHSLHLEYNININPKLFTQLMQLGIEFPDPSKQ